MASSGDPIEAVILDMGGVITTSPFPLMNAYGDESGLPPGLLAARMRSAAPMIERAERGEITLRRYFEMVADDIRSELGIEVDARRLVGCIEESIVPMDGVLDLVRAIRRGCRTAILTNNAQDLAAVWQARLPDDLVDVIVDSSVVRMRKPDPEIYHLTLDRLGVDAGRAVFVDDQEINLVPAREIGMHAICFQSIDQLERELVGLGVVTR
jgi:putative hydrolase of the HAD superfamily